jgi:hypothetical protein
MILGLCRVPDFIDYERDMAEYERWKPEREFKKWGSERSRGAEETVVGAGS